MKVKEIQQAFYRYSGPRYELLLPNTILDGWLEADLLGVRRSRFCDEVEVKLSSADFRADFAKKVTTWDCEARTLLHSNKHERLAARDCKPNYFSFLVPHALLDKVQVPDYAGLYVAQEFHGYLRIREMKPAPRLHSAKLTDRETYVMARKMMFRYWRAESSL